MQLRLLKLLPNQIADHWESLKPTIEASLPPICFDTQDRMYLILEALLDGRMDLLTFFGIDEEMDVSIRGIMTVTFDKAIGVEFKTMFIYSIFAFGEYSEGLWMQAVDLLKKYAQANDCKRVTALTKVRSLLALLKHIGADTDTHYIMWEV